ncbi:MAG: hypothetical protein RsTaC01_0750 [Candidatus Paraimprobicoccus trichonymphae]|uniref:Uncharacterized protein n=1 Tax=Candidatus Paraimprobicoccus trichonymphae TaxID=3033793 RepID=A0AA48ICA1_9FIRM|nr:MAG: hypothetical protein RsTaC01_0750 [Candidatus Paraimprobicoccus trichonymphae]
MKGKEKMNKAKNDENIDAIIDNFYIILNSADGIFDYAKILNDKEMRLHSKEIFETVYKFIILAAGEIKKLDINKDKDTAEFDNQKKKLKKLYSEKNKNAEFKTKIYKKAFSCQKVIETLKPSGKDFFTKKGLLVDEENYNEYDYGINLNSCVEAINESLGKLKGFIASVFSTFDEAPEGKMPEFFSKFAENCQKFGKIYLKKSQLSSYL